MKSRNLKFLEPSGPLLACNGTALPYIYTYIYKILYKYIWVYYIFEHVHNDFGLCDVSSIAINFLCYRLISRKTREILLLL